jgi:hypothetical protein
MNKPSNLATALANRPVGASQATAIEQQRAIAQVQAAIVVARHHPRDEIGARDRMERACQLPSLAERAFFRYARGGGQVTGASIHLATELARCWGNIDYGISELRRDDIKGESEMLAYAWDLETNARNANTFIVPHKRDKRGGAELLTDMRDIYENNANMGARRLRECIFHVLPKPFLEEAKTIAMQTLEHGGGEPIEKRRVTLLEAFATLRVTRKQIETKIGRAADKLTAYDIGVLRVIYQSIRRGESTVAEEFPDDRAAEVQAQLQGPKPAGTAAADAGAALTTSEAPSEVAADGAIAAFEARMNACATIDDLKQLYFHSEEGKAYLTADDAPLAAAYARNFDRIKRGDT